MGKSSEAKSAKTKGVKVEKVIREDKGLKKVPKTPGDSDDDILIQLKKTNEPNHGTRSDKQRVS